MAPTSIETDTRPGSNSKASQVPSRLYSLSEPPSLNAFQRLCSQSTRTDIYPLASSVQSNIPIYDLPTLSHSDAHATERLQDEWNHILLSGPGVLVLKSLFPDRNLLSRINDVFSSIIASELASSNGSSKGDHFATSGKNSRIWNSFQKHGQADPDSFLQYYSNPWLAIICSSWLGPAYRITAQVNLVRPGGPAQVSHRDYHLGFQTTAQCAQYPRPMHVASQLLTLQGGIAHCDMPLESGPTRFLPFSQMFDSGFMAYRIPEFQQYFEEHFVTLPLKMGDAVFFNPAIFHAAGENITRDVERCANLLQVSSPFSKPMESIDSLTLLELCWERLYAKYTSEGASARVKSFIAAVAEGYPFPLNLDYRIPAPGGMAPESEQELLQKGLEEGWGTSMLMRQLRLLRKDSMP